MYKDPTAIYDIQTGFLQGYTERIQDDLCIDTDPLRSIDYPGEGMQYPRRSLSTLNFVFHASTSREDPGKELQRIRLLLLPFTALVFVHPRTRSVDNRI